MKQVDIIEAMVNAIEETIFNDWKHEGFINCYSSEHISVVIDNKRYNLRIHELEDGEMF